MLLCVCIRFYLLPSSHVHVFFQGILFGFSWKKEEKYMENKQDLVQVFNILHYLQHIVSVLLSSPVNSYLL